MTSAPTIEALEKMIGQAYGALPHADETWLREIEARVAPRGDTPPRRNVPRAIWILGAFFAAGAAAWWTGNLLWPDEPAPAAQISNAHQPAREQKNAPAQTPTEP
jgi:hypothetical protein